MYVCNACIKHVIHMCTSCYADIVKFFAQLSNKLIRKRTNCPVFLIIICSQTVIYIEFTKFSTPLKTYMNACTHARINYTHTDTEKTHMHNSAHTTVS